jgi:RNA methyltransferase, TrmH family
VIDSIRDERIVAARGLATRQGRLAAGRCLIEGEHLIAQAIEAGVEVVYVLRAPGTAPIPDSHEVREGLLRKVIGVNRPVTCLAVATVPPEVTGRIPGTDFAVVLENVADPGNLGTIVRSACAMGVRDIVLTDAETDLTSRRVLEAARASSLTARIQRFDDSAGAVEELKRAGFQIVATSPRGAHLQALAPLERRPVALVVGNETAGVSEEILARADLVVQIPMAGPVESLNVGVATGISVYELRMRLVMTMLTDRIRSTFGRELSVTSAFVRSALDAALREAGELNSDQLVLLMIVACERSTDLAQLRKDLAIDAAELGEALGPLQASGYVRADGVAVEITVGGEQALAAMWAVQERVEAKLFAGFTDQEREQLMSYLSRVQHNAL